MIAEASLGCARAFITLSSTEFEPLVEFYGALLGQEAKPYQADRYAEFCLPGLRLAIFRPKPDQATQFSAPHSGAMSLCLEVADLGSAIALLTHLGYPPPGPIMTASHGSEIYAYDPDGNRLILHQGLVQVSA